MQGQGISPEANSPMNNLNDRFSKQNGILEELLMRLQNRLNKLSDTENKSEGQKGEQPPTPFNAGHMMYYNDQLTRNEGLLSVLDREVNKLENLI